MNKSKQFLTLARATYNQAARASTEVAGPPRMERLRQLQKDLQLDESTPVHLKGGFKDKIVYRAAAGLVFICIGCSIEAFYRVATGNK